MDKLTATLWEIENELASVIEEDEPIQPLWTRVMELQALIARALRQADEVRRRGR